MKIYSADTWTLEELQEQISDAGRRTLLVPPATTKQAVLEVFGQVLDFPEYYGVNLDALNDSLHDYADALSEDDGSPVTMIWQVRRPTAQTVPSEWSAKSCKTQKATPAGT